MKTNKPYFHNIKVGDHVWSLNYGWGEVSRINVFGFQVKFYRKAVLPYRFTGKRHKYPDDMQTLFWDEIPITPPPRPVPPITLTDSHGRSIPLEELKSDVEAARERFMDSEYSFTIPTVQALINKLEQLHKELHEKE